MVSSSPAAPGSARKPWYHPTLTRQIMVGLVIGCLVGWWINGLPEASHASWNTWLRADP